jgi:putative ABC transport system permease protein
VSAHPSRAVRWSERAYRVLIYLYPRDFRHHLGDEMRRFAGDRFAAASLQGAWGVMRAWLYVLPDLVATAALERVAALRAAGSRRRRAELHPDPAISYTSRNEEMRLTLMQDLRYAIRSAIRRPGFSAIVLSTLALGIGANAAIFSVVNGVLLRPLPFAAPDGIVQITHTEPSWLVSEPEFVDYRDGARSLSGTAAFAVRAATLTGNDAPERVQIARVSAGFFEILGTRPVAGRILVPEDDKRRKPRVVMISHAIWTRRYGADPALVGSQIRINDVPVTVVGIMPAGFDFPTPEVALWVPLRLNYDTLWTRNNHYLTLIARVAKGSTVARTSTELNAIARRSTVTYPDAYTKDKPLVATVQPIEDVLVGKTRPYLFALLGAVGFVLLIACVNVANLLLARGETRRKELAIRTALGASRARLTLQALLESSVYAVTGGALGLVLAWWGVRLLRAVAPASIPRVANAGIDLRVLAFTIALSLVTGLLFGLAPALRAARKDAGDTLKEGGKTSGHAHGMTSMRGALVVVEVALAVVMLTGAGLMVRSLWKLHQVDLGFDATNVLTMRVDPSFPVAGLQAPPSQAEQQERPARFYQEIMARVRALPGVTAAGAVADLPIGDGNSIWSILLDGQPMTSVSQSPSAMPQQVTPGYFAALGIPIVRGRGFTETDRDGAPLVAVVNEAMVKERWPSRDPIGHTLKMLNDSSPWVTIVGVVKDVRSNGFEGRVPPTMYFPHAQAGKSAYYTPTTMTLVVKTAGDAQALAGPIRQVVRALDPSVPVSRVQTMERVVAASVANRRFSTLLLAGFALLALILGAVGIYGVLSFDVSQRTFEIGLRLALGAQPGQVLGLMLQRGVVLAGIGLAIGLAGAVALTRLIASLLVGVTGTDPLTMAGVTMVLGAAALLASYLPARRATRLDPLLALRAE